MKTLPPTHAALLAKIQGTAQRGYTVEVARGQSIGGGRVCQGVGELKAARALESRGLVRSVSLGLSRVLTGGGHSVSVVSIRFFVKEVA